MLARARPPFIADRSGAESRLSRDAVSSVSSLVTVADHAAMRDAFAGGRRGRVPGDGAVCGSTVRLPDQEDKHSASRVFRRCNSPILAEPIADTHTASSAKSQGWLEATLLATLFARFCIARCQDLFLLPGDLSVRDQPSEKHFRSHAIGDEDR